MSYISNIFSAIFTQVSAITVTPIVNYLFRIDYDNSVSYHYNKCQKYLNADRNINLLDKDSNGQLIFSSNNTKQYKINDVFNKSEIVICLRYVSCIDKTVADPNTRYNFEPKTITQEYLLNSNIFDEIYKLKLYNKLPNDSYRICYKCK